MTPAVVPVDDTATTAVSSIEAGYSINLSSDVAGFEASLQKADNASLSEQASAVTAAIMEPLDYINREANSLAEYAENAIASGNELTPSEIVMLTARSQEFMFHAQLTANVANRTADGMQQLFRQQS
ncbi:MAG: hypothetical protein KTR35_07590 [Gammaproteobacteria bacterium]|nr:hypothetical protein [Gammaproteobacteria bacterium]